MDFLDQILAGVEQGATFGIEEAADAISEKLDDVDDPIAAFVLGAAADALREHGIAGVGIARAEFEALLDGDNIDPEALRELPLYQRAPLLAAATEREINARRAGDKAFAAFGKFLGGLVKGLATGAFRA